MASIESKMERLTAKNYSTWKTVMTSLLMSRGLWPYVKATKYETEEDKIKNEEAKHLIYVSMDPNQITATGTCETANELWKKVKENHEGAEQNLRNNALAEFLSFRFIRNESIVSYCGRFELALGRLTGTGHAVDESTKLWVFRNTLPKDVKATVQTWTLARPDGTVSELISQLKIQHHMDRLDLHDDTVALHTQEQRKRFDRNKPNWQKRSNNPGFRKETGNSHQPKGGNFSSNNKGNSQQIICSHCKIPGHRWRECRKLKEDNKRKKRFGSLRRDERQNRPNPSAFTAEAPRHSCSLGKYTWIVDSGASSHMTSYKEYMIDYEEFEKPHLIILGDGKATKAIGKGNIPFVSGHNSGELKSVLLVPDLKENLFSVCRAMGQGCEVRFINNPPAVVFNKQGKTVLRGHRFHEGFFLIHMKPTAFSKQRQEQAFTGATIDEWHRRFAHCSKEAIKELMRKGAVKGIKINNESTDRCKDCVIGKICRTHHPSKQGILASESAAVLHIDTCGPIKTPSIGNSKYFVLATEEYSNYKLIQAVPNKSCIPDVVKEMINKTELESKRPVKMILTDNGTEYVNRDLERWLSKRGIIHSYAASYTPEQNGRAERANRTVLEGVRTLLHDSGLGEELWAEAANVVVYITNRMLSPRDKEKTRYELFRGSKPDVGNLKRFGQKAIVKEPDNARNGKLSKKGEECVFVGYTDRYNTFRFYTDKPYSQVFVSCDAVFLNEQTKVTEERKEDNEIVVKIGADKSNPAQINNESDEETTQSESDHSSQPYMTGKEQGSVSTSSYEEELSDTQEEVVETRRPFTRSRAKQQVSQGTENEQNEESDYDGPSVIGATEMALFTLDDEPLTLKDAQSREDWDKWKQAMDEEIEALNKNKTWVLVDRPSNVKPIKNKWVFKVKLDPNGEVERYKARLVAKGYTQIENVDYKETYAPVASMNTIRLFFSIANKKGMYISQFDIKTAFLYGDLEEDIYMEYPEGYPCSGNKVCKLIKSLYGLKQAPRNWNKKFDGFLQKFHLNQANVDKCLYYSDDRSLLLAIYVDDGLAAAKNRMQLDSLINYLKQIFELKTMECEAYLGLQVYRNMKDRTLKLVQTNYIDKVLERFGMKDCKSSSTPEEVGAKFDDSTLLPTEFKFKELVGSLLYLATCTRPDISHAVSVASRTSQPTQAHWTALKRILRYLHGTRDIGIHFRWEKSTELIAYSDADYANDPETRKSTTGYCIFYGGPIAWRCQRQAIVTLSTTEAEYVAGCELVKELIPIREQLAELGEIDQRQPTTVFIDNQSAVKIATNESGQQRTKHIDIRQKWLTEQAAKKKIEVKHVSGDQQAADILTKPLHKTKFINNRNLLMMTAIALIMVTTTMQVQILPKTNPLFFRPTDYQFFDGDTEFYLTHFFMNPCETFFNSSVYSPDENAYLISKCNYEFGRNLLDNLSNCHRLPDIGHNLSWTPRNHICGMGSPLSVCESDPPFEYANFSNKGESRFKRSAIPQVLDDSANEFTALSRSKRGFWIPFMIIGSLTAIAGMSTHTYKIAKGNAENLDILAKMDEQQNILLHEARAVFEEYKDTVTALTQWSSEVDDRMVRGLDKTYAGKIANLIRTYDSFFREHGETLKAINAALRKNKISPEIQALHNGTLWDEPASDFSTIFNCSYRLQHRNLFLSIHFILPKINKLISIKEAVSLDFYNSTKDQNGMEKICWMKYKGPKHILYNSTNNCKTELLESMVVNKGVRAQTCEGKKDELGEGAHLWEPDTCHSKIYPTKRTIQDKEVDGLHRIYCYPFNITIYNETQQCPDYVFEVEGRASYQIANIAHYGAYIERTVVKSADIHANNEILASLRADYVPMGIKRLNVTKLDSILSNYTMKLKDLPKKLNITNPALKSLFEDVLGGSLDTISNWYGSIIAYLRTFGIIMGIIAGLFFLVLLMPLIEIFFVGFKLVKYPIQVWFSSIRRTLSKIPGLNRVKLPSRWKRNKWEDEYKLI